MGKVQARKTPGFPLSGTLEMLREIREKLGFGAASRETVLNALGHQKLTGTSARKVAALSHYGLVDRDGEMYQISELGKRILMPHTPEEQADALVEAAKSPTFFQEIWAAYEGQALPSMLGNILTRQYGVHPNSAEDAAVVLRETATFAGLLRNGVLYGERADGAAGPSAETPESRLPSADDRPAPAPASSVAQPTGPGTRQRYSVPLDHEGRVATVEMPLPVTAEDLKALELWAAYMKSLRTNSPDTSGN